MVLKYASVRMSMYVYVRAHVCLHACVCLCMYIEVNKAFWFNKVLSIVDSLGLYIKSRVLKSILISSSLFLGNNRVIEFFQHAYM